MCFAPLLAPKTRGSDVMSIGRSARSTRVASLDRPLIVHSHVRWDFLWQRPQQILSRLALHAPVLVIEQPVFHTERVMARLELSSPATNVTRAVPHLPGSLSAQVDHAIEMIRSLAVAATSPGGALEERFDAPVQWFYTPAPAPAMLGAFDEVGVVYECMEEASRHPFVAPGMDERERLLLRHADLVFTNGTRLYEAKRLEHANVQLVGCGVDVVRFGRARLASTPLPRDLEGLAGPLVGYVGVIDSRVDFELLALLADARPDVTIVMVGPVLPSVTPHLPERPNIAWLGAKPYDDLPAYVKAFAGCIMPYAVTDATDHINPTTALEYMAAGKPIVSTAIRDVVGQLRSVVRVAESREAFVRDVGAAITRPDARAIARGHELARRSSWESITGRVRVLVRDSIFGPVGDDASRDITRPWSRAELEAGVVVADGEMSA
jgi:glycosyltransferase involved in cell wall biosynthesis